VNQTLARQLDALVGTDLPDSYTGLACESPLRVAAATLSRASSNEITATTVVGILGKDDASAFQELVGDIAAEFGLETRIRMHVGSFSVRFSRAAPRSDPLQH
jgi:hypothetical protein